MPTSISGTPPATTTRGSTTSRRSRSATATIEPSAGRYLPPDYLADAAPYTRRQDGVRRSRVGSARSGRRDALHRGPAPAHRACRAWPWRRPGSTATTLRRVLEQQAAFDVRAQRPPQAARQRGPSDASPGGTTDARVARGIRAAGAARPALRPADAVVAHARGGATGRRLPGNARSSSITRACRRIAPPRASRGGARRWPRSRSIPTWP